jgi:hypothetical protein
VLTATLVSLSDSGDTAGADWVGPGLELLLGIWSEGELTGALPEEA